MKRLKDFAPILIMVGCAAVIGTLLATDIIDLDTIPQMVEDKPLLAVFIILTLYILKGFSGVIIYNALVIAVSLIFPLPQALIVNGIGTAITLSISYLIGSHTKTESIEGLLDKHPKLRKYFSATRQYGFISCFAVHLLNLSMEVLGVLFGMLGIRFLTYLVSSWLAIIPGMICFTIVGHDLDIRSPALWIVLAIDLILIAFGFLYTKKKLLNDNNCP